MRASISQLIPAWLTPCIATPLHYIRNAFFHPEIMLQAASPRLVRQDLFAKTWAIAAWRLDRQPLASA